MFDPYLLPINLVEGQEVAELPGLLATTAPRKTERSRSNDILIILLTLTGNATISQNIRDELLYPLSSAYYNTRGSVTAGLRASAERLNGLLYKLSRQNAVDGLLTLGLLNLIVLRKDQLYLTNAGPTHSFLLTETGLQDFFNSQDAGRGLGLRRTISLHYHQANIRSGDLIILCPNPPKIWYSVSLTSSNELSLNHLRRRLLNQCGDNLQAVIIQLRRGKGLIHRLKPRSLADETSSQEISNTETHVPEAVPLIRTISTSSDTQEHVTGILDTEKTLIAEETALSDDINHINGITPIPEPSPSPTLSRISRRRKRSKTRSKLSASRFGSTNWRKTLADLWLSVRTIVRRVKRYWISFLTRMLPGTLEQSPNFSKATLLFITISIPLLIAVVTTTLYYYNGRDEQHLVYLQQAQQLAAQAADQSDVSLKRNNWTQTIYWLDKAEEYGKTEGSIALRQYAQQALDDIDGIVRLFFQPTVLGGLSNTIEITQIAASDSDIYLLDGAKGQVLRLYMKGDGYEVDPDFDCGPRPSIGQLDLIVLPPSAPFNATVLAVDNSGNYIYCTPENPANSTRFIPPDCGWSNITAISTYQNKLYLLDAKNNAVWLIYPATEELNYSENPPRLFFDKEIPILADVIDLTANGDDLYLLHQKGTLSHCSFRKHSEDETKCIDPATFGDLRPENEIVPLTFANAQFTQVLSTSPPDPSLFILDVSAPIIFHFSLQRNLKRQLYPQAYDEDYPLPDEMVTAFTISPTNIALLAYGNQIFYTQMP